MKKMDQEQLERYLLDQMPEAERLRFEEHLRSDPDLTVQKNELEEIILAIGYEALAQKLEKFKIGKANPVAEKSGLEEKKPPQQKVIRMWSPLRIAASVLILAVAAYFLFAPQSRFSGRHWDEIFYPDPGLPTVMSSTDRYLFYDGMVDYKSGNFGEAAQKWEEVTEVGRDTVDYYIGMAQLRLKKWETAETHLLTVPEESSFYTLANWYLIRIYLHSKQYDQAAQLLPLIPTHQEGYQEVKEYLSKKTE